MLSCFQQTGEQVAIKEFSARESRQAILARRREVELLRKFKHKNVIQLYDCEQEVMLLIIFVTRGSRKFRQGAGVGSSKRCFLSSTYITESRTDLTQEAIGPKGQFLAQVGSFSVLSKKRGARGRGISVAPLRIHEHVCVKYAIRSVKQ